MLRLIRCQAGEERITVKQNEKFICLKCEEPQHEFSFVCIDCGAEETIIPIEEFEEENEAQTPKRSTRAKKIIDVTAKLPPKISTGRRAWDIVLDGGLTRPSSTMVVGAAGVGKSTSLLEIADTISNKLKRPALYASGEMPAELVRQTANRLNLSMRYLYVNATTDASDIHEDIEDLKPCLVVWDSIQAFQVEGESGLVIQKNLVKGANEIGQRHKLMTMFITQVTKEEEFAGLNTIRHDVDTEIILRKNEEGRIIVTCPVKNRWGKTPKTAIEDLC
jgi:DNA repair protein RadA/Sms